MADRFEHLPRLARILIAGVGGYLVSVLITELLLRGSGLSATFQPFYLGVIGAAVAAGAPGGLLATLLATVSQSAEVGRGADGAAAAPADITGLILFVAIASAVSELAGRLHRERRRAVLRGNRLAQLAENAGAMARASSTQDIARVLVDGASRATGALAGGIAIADRERRGLVVTACSAAGGPIEGWTDGTLLSWDEPVPVAAAYRDNAPRWFVSRAEAEAAFPALASARRRPDAGGLAAVPLIVDGRTFGAAWLTFPEGRPSDSGDRSFVTALVGHAGQALERARLFGAEHEARVRAESAEQAVGTSLQTLAAAVAVVPDPVFVVDATGRVVLRNPAADRVFGGDGPATLAAVAERLRTASDGTATPADLAAAPALRLASSTTWLEPHLVRQPTGGDVVLVLRDVTQVRDMRAAHDAFLGVLSHELRTPVTTIYGTALLLSRPFAAGRVKEFAQDMQIEAERLKRLVDDLLVLSRVERERLEIGDEPVLLQRVIPAVVEAERRRLPDSEFEVHIADDLPPVMGDATYVEQIVRNLLSNAVKYGAPGGRISVTGSTEDGRGVTVRVLDTGRGFSDEEAERLFELFYRSASTSAAPGAGIGLFVTRQLVTTMGGRIWARPRPEGGAEFGFELRAVDETVDRAAEPGTPPAGEAVVA